MAFLNKLVGYPDPDPRGRSRALFEKVGNQAMTMLMRGDVSRALQHALQLEGMIAHKYNAYHPDVGRARLLAATIQTTVGQYETALEACEAALEVLRDSKEVAELDLEAAEFLSTGLNKLVDGEYPVDDPSQYLISRETVIGQWLWRLRP